MRVKSLARPSSAKKIKRIALGAITLLVMGIFIIVHSMINQPANGYVQAASETNDQNSVAAAEDNTTYQVNGKYLNFQYPGFFRPVPVEKPTGAQLSTFDYIAKSSPFWELAVQISSLPSGNLDNDGSYHMRSVSPDRYQRLSWTAGGSPVTVFADKNDGYSKAAYIAHQGKLVSIALTGSGDETRMDQVLQGVLNSLEWE
jgi:hypothetical protein